MRRTITPIDTTTHRASAGSVARVNETHYYPRKFGFVLDKASQLAESPRVVLSPLAMPNRDAVSNTLKVFEGDTPTAVFSSFNNTLADYMINIGSKSLFFAGTLFKKSLCLFRTVGLEFRPHLGVSLSKTIDLSPRVGCPIGVGSDIYNTQVNPKKAIRFIRRRLWGIHYHCQVKYSISNDKVGLPDYSIKPCFLIAPDSDRDKLSTGKGKYGYLVQPFPRENTLVINDSTISFEGGLDRAVSFVGFGNLANSTDGKLRRKPKFLSYFTINSFLETHLAGCSKGKRSIGNEIAGLIETLHSLQKCFMLVWARCEFNHQGLLHISIKTQLIGIVNTLTKGESTNSSPCLKTGASLALRW